MECQLLTNSRNVYLSTYYFLGCSWDSTGGWSGLRIGADNAQQSHREFRSWDGTSERTGMEAMDLVLYSPPCHLWKQAAPKEGV